MVAFVPSDRTEQVGSHGDVLEVAQNAEMKLVCLRKCGENIGVDYATQYGKMINNPTVVVVIVTTTGPDGKNYDMIGIMWRRTGSRLALEPWQGPRPERR